MKRLFTSFLAVCTLLAVAFATTGDKRETNAQRLRRGLGPLPPTKTYDPTRARRAMTSPGTTITGYVAVTGAGGTCYIQPSDSPPPQCGPLDSAQPLSYVSGAQSPQGIFDDNGGYLNIFTFTGQGTYFCPDQPTLGLFVFYYPSTGPDPADSPGNESNVFTIDPVTGTILTSWENPTENNYHPECPPNQVLDTYLYSGTVYVTADPAGVAIENSPSVVADPVTLTFVQM